MLGYMVAGARWLTWWKVFWAYSFSSITPRSFSPYRRRSFVVANDSTLVFVVSSSTESVAFTERLHFGICCVILYWERMCYRTTPLWYLLCLPLLRAYVLQNDSTVVFVVSSSTESVAVTERLHFGICCVILYWERSCYRIPHSWSLKG